MARRGAASSDTIAASFTPAEFVPSRTLTAQSKSISLSLIKVPKFVAESWRSAVADATAGILKNDNGKQVLIVRDPLTGGACHLESIFLQNDKSLVLQKNGKQLLDVIGELQSRTNFQPKLDHRYQQVLHKRHVAEDLHKSRGTVEEMRRDPGLDSLHTLFQFYTPRASLSAEENAKRGLESISRAKAKQKRGAVLDADSLKVKLFKMFDAAGASGLQLKQIASQTQQPLSHVKMIVEEIAEQRKRLSDRKAVYFLKQQYSIVQKGKLHTLRLKEVAEEWDFMDILVSCVGVHLLGHVHTWTSFNTSEVKDFNNLLAVVKTYSNYLSKYADICLSAHG
ncbi:uncharacterized protein LOC34619873 [Cyclospora cayetanensis]|uniref:Uncharacterized protein LOC34619873 n=1 Tax=Cyclospora cayetanensis TaxID=88456 RepID=A0A6P6RV62_9EIME|nr:uncharacterized protein LOC34619873 [Cyclospora cayetanensis]